MRVISQDGTFDVPYEISSFSMVDWENAGVCNAAIYCYNSSTVEEEKMAEYNSKEKAKKAMELLRTAYTGQSVMLRDFDNRVEFNNSNRYFQFPTEEELDKAQSGIVGAGETDC